MVERLQVGHASTPAGPWVKVPTRVVSTPGGSVTESEEDSFIWKGQWTTPPPPFAAGVDDAVVDMVLYGGVLDDDIGGVVVVVVDDAFVADVVVTTVVVLLLLLLLLLFERARLSPVCILHCREPSRARRWSSSHSQRKLALSRFLSVPFRSFPFLSFPFLSFPFLSFPFSFIFLSFFPFLSFLFLSFPFYSLRALWRQAGAASTC